MSVNKPQTMTVWAIVITLTACMPQWPTTPIPDAAYPGLLRDSRLLPDGFHAHQRVTAEVMGHRESFTAVIEVHEGVLRMLALTGFGTRAFLIEQRGRDVTLTEYTEQRLPFPPRFILLDLHRALFIGIDAPPQQDGERSAIIGADRITERFANGRLIERRYQRVNDKPEGEIVITYEGDARAPRHAHLNNQWFDYRLDITTLGE